MTFIVHSSSSRYFQIKLVKENLIEDILVACIDVKPNIVCIKFASVNDDVLFNDNPGHRHEESSV